MAKPEKKQFETVETVTQEAEDQTQSTANVPENAIVSTPIVRNKRSQEEKTRDAYMRMFSETEKLLSNTFPKEVDHKVVKFDKCIMHVSEHLYSLLKKDKEQGGIFSQIAEANKIRFIYMDF